jgi:hypothetical protein
MFGLRALYVYAAMRFFQRARREIRRNHPDTGAVAIRCNHWEAEWRRRST